eukprot:jgi/Astpho2/129/gw1.00004.161.1_t
MSSLWKPWSCMAGPGGVSRTILAPKLLCKSAAMRRSSSP